MSATPQATGTHCPAPPEPACCYRCLADSDPLSPPACCLLGDDAPRCRTEEHRSRHYDAVDGHRYCATCVGAAFYRALALANGETAPEPPAVPDLPLELEVPTP